ncbi:MAG: YihY family inner membrane protein [Burkholderiaceae bacterium]|nr:MAG: YihY family inner membrane protein [Burkholderiaceae bacterium]
MGGGIIVRMTLQNLKARARNAAFGDSDAPALTVAAVLWERLRQDRLALTASSLTYTTILALVPLFTVVLSVFTLFPTFRAMEGALQQWLVESLIPTDIASNVMDYLTQFASKASQLGLLGIAGLAVIALSLILTVDKTLNQIWRASDKRPLGQRVLVYWAALTLGPLVLGASVAITSYVLTTSQGWFPGLSGGADFALGLLQFLLLTGGLTLLYRFVPNTPVRWKHALVGALFVTLTLAIAKWGLGVYLGSVHTYAHIYGAFAALPILLLWIYVSWLIVLFGAVIAAYLPSIVGGRVRRSGLPGWQFELALEVLGALSATRGLTLPQLAHQLRVDVLQLGAALTTLRTMDWIGRLATQNENEDPRYVLLAHPEQPVLPLVERLLVNPDTAFVASWREKPLSTMCLGDALPAQSAAGA